MIAAAVLDTLHDAGLVLELTPEHAVKVSPASRLTSELRTLIRNHKGELVALLEAANDDHSEPEKKDWHELAATYYAHHFGCADCIAAGRGHMYGERCAGGAVLWKNYQESTKT